MRRKTSGPCTRRTSQPGRRSRRRLATRRRTPGSRRSASTGGDDRAAPPQRAARRPGPIGGQRDDEAAGRAPRRRWVAASIGPYGAMLADGSEYRGDYGLSVEELRDFHRPRLQVLAQAVLDLPDGDGVLAVETIPSLAEVEALAAELAGPGVPAWVSVTPDGDRLRTGEPPWRPSGSPRRCPKWSPSASTAANPRTSTRRWPSRRRPISAYRSSPTRTPARPGTHGPGLDRASPPGL